ncbi:MAG: hypothetical protein EOP88_11460 [Verrucomicrobiaceae bacterium]|nr:MAG: hypothetical protein EOP88_11460 [Verrucomicrobiaceae bacterium]
MKKSILTISCSLVLSPAAFCAGLEFGSAFTPGMVIQRDATITVTGKGTAGGKVDVSLGAQKGSAKVEQDGHWKVELPAMKVGGPFSLEASDGKDTASVGDVLLGDVWVFSGQSNMQMGLDEMQGGKEAVAIASKDPKLRLLLMPKAGADTPQDDVEAKWQKATPESLKKFSAVAASFAIHLHKDAALAEVPLGIIDTSFGGTAIEAWTPKGTLPDIPEDQISQSMFNIPPGNLFNKMIAPLTAYRIKGAAWYQGEANAGRPTVYTPLLKNMMTQWRKQWSQPELPFFVVQLPAFEGKWDGLDFGWQREAQERACKESTHAWSVVTYDTAKGDDLHPVEKEEIGRRISLLAAKEVYGLHVVAHGPVVKGSAAQGDTMTLTFDSQLKISKGEKLLGFSLAGQDGEYRFAEAKLDGSKVVLRAEGVPQPKTVRFAWGGQPDANLVNAAGLPAAAFRTDKQGPKTLAFQPLPTAFRIDNKLYQLETGSTGNIASLIVDGKQFLSAEPGGGTSIPTFGGRRNLAKIKAVGPGRVVFSDSNASMEIACADDSLVLMVRNEGNEGIDFQIAMAPQAQVTVDGSSATVTRDKAKLLFQGIDRADNDGRIIVKLEPHKSREIRVEIKN